MYQTDTTAETTNRQEHRGDGAAAESDVPGSDEALSSRHADRESPRHAGPETSAVGAETDRLRLWYFITALSVGGAERTLVDLANELDPDRFEVTIWTMFEQNYLANTVADHVELRTLGVEGVGVTDDFATIEGAASPLGYLAIPLRFARAIRRERPDIVQSFLVYDNVVARIAGRFSPETVVVSGERLGGVIPNRLMNVVDRLTLRFADYVVANSEAGAAFHRRRGAPAESVRVVHNGRDLEAYRTGDGSELRPILGIPESAPIVGTVGRLDTQKGQDDLLDAWPAVRDAHPDAHLVLVGDGAERTRLADRVSADGDLGSASVHFVGSSSRVPDYLDLFDVFVFPSHFEGLPGALLEAMAAGCPVVATAIDGNTDLVTDGETGRLVPVRDPEALAAGISELLADRETAERFGVAARAETDARFSLEAMVGGFTAFYEEISGRETSPPAAPPSTPASSLIRDRPAETSTDGE